MSQTFTPEQYVLIEWLATPKKFRSPKSYEGLADSLGTTRMTLYRWKRLDGFSDAVVARAKARVAKYLPDVLQAITDKAIEGSAQHARMFVEIHEDSFNKRTVEVTDGRAERVRDMSDDEVVTRIHQIMGKGKHGDMLPDRETLLAALLTPDARPAAEA